MPRVRREDMPEAVLRHLALRARQRHISFDQLGQMSDWLETEPIVPEGKWYKRFSGFTLCGEGELVKTFLMIGQLPDGKEIL